MMAKHLSGENDTPERREELIELASKASLRRIQDCVSDIQRERWEKVFDNLYYALYHVAKATLFLEGKDPTSHHGTKLEFSRALKAAGLPKDYIRFYGNSERLRNVGTYSYMGEVEYIDEEESREALGEGMAWVEHIIEKMFPPEIKARLTPFVKETRQMVDDILSYGPFDGI